MPYSVTGPTYSTTFTLSTHSVTRLTHSTTFTLNVTHGITPTHSSYHLHPLSVMRGILIELSNFVNRDGFLSPDVTVKDASSTRVTDADDSDHSIPTAATAASPSPPKTPVKLHKKQSGKQRRFVQ